MFGFFLTTSACSMLYCLFQWCLKMSIALLYLRVFILRTSVRRLMYALTAFTCANSWTYIFLFIFQCHPIGGRWDPRIKARCINPYAGFIASSVANILIDFALIVIVLPCIYALNLRKAQKVGLLIIVNLGWVTILAAILRTKKVDQVVKSKKDPTWSVLDIIVWTSVECSTMMVCGAAPVTKPLLEKILSIMPAGWVTNSGEVIETDLTEQTGASNFTNQSESTGKSFVLENAFGRNST
jgi:hypothetical protein